MAAAALRPMRPESIRVAPMDTVKRPTLQEEADAKGFVMNIRSAAPYLHLHAGKIMVVHMSSELIGTPHFSALMDDLGLIKLLGVRLVLVCSLRAQVDRRLKALGKGPTPVVGDYRVTDAETLQVIKEMSGSARAEVEARMSRSLKSGTTVTGLEGVNVIGGNLFFTPQPIGVREGVDFGYSGEVRRVDVDSLTKRLAMGDLILLTSLGYASSGECYDVLSESLACEVASELGAHKLLWVTDGHTFATVTSSSQSGASGAGGAQHADGGGGGGRGGGGGSVVGKEQQLKEDVQLVQSMRLSDATALLRHYDVGLKPKFSDSSLTPALPGAASAAEGGGAVATVGAVAAGAHTTPLVVAAVGVGGGGNSESRAESEGEVLGTVAALPPTSATLSSAAPSSPQEAPSTLSSVPCAKRAAEAGLVADEHMGRLVNLVRFSVAALQRGVVRAHLVPPGSGELLRELYTSDGAGTLISRDLYDGIRKAHDQDIPGILAIIEPLVAQGILVARTAADLLANLDCCYVFVRDRNVVACGQLVPFSPNSDGEGGGGDLAAAAEAAAGGGTDRDGTGLGGGGGGGGVSAAAGSASPASFVAAEISCLAVSPVYRGAKRGDAMLTYLEHVAVAMGVTEVFVLTSRTLEFFAERGFDEVSPSWLPAARPYDKERRSKVFRKHLRNHRDIDMEELFWDSGVGVTNENNRRRERQDRSSNSGGSSLGVFGGRGGGGVGGGDSSGGGGGQMRENTEYGDGDIDMERDNEEMTGRGLSGGFQFSEQEINLQRLRDEWSHIQKHPR